MVTMLGGACVALVLLAVVGFFVMEAMNKKRAQEALAARGNELGSWTVYYDVKKNRIGLTATFPERELIRYLFFRIHDLFDYNQGLESERRRIAEALLAAARGNATENWEFLFPAPMSECFHSSQSPNGTLFKFFEGKLWEHAIDQPRFIGGDSIAKQKGLLGECIAIIQHLGKAGKIGEATVRLIESELNGGPQGQGARFWNLPNQAFRETQ